MTVGMTLLYCPESTSWIWPHVLWHSHIGVGLFEATLHNPDEAMLRECEDLQRLVSFTWRVTGGPITTDEQVMWTNGSIERLIEKGADYIMTADDDEWYMGWDNRTALYDGYSYYETECDPDGIPPLSMTWRDPAGTSYEYAKVGFKKEDWSGSMEVGNHCMKNVDRPSLRLPGMIRHFTYRAGKPMFAHRKDVTYQRLTMQDVIDKHLAPDFTVREELTRILERGYQP